MATGRLSPFTPTPLDPLPKCATSEVENNQSHVPASGGRYTTKTFRQARMRARVGRGRPGSNITSSPVRKLE